MSLSKIRELLSNHEKPIVIYNLQGYQTEKSFPTDLEHSFGIKDDKSVPINKFEEEYRNKFLLLRSNGMEKLRIKQQNMNEMKCKTESTLKNWIQKIEIIEESTKGCLWTIKENQPACISGSEAERDEMYIMPRFLTDPERFNKGHVSINHLQNYSLYHTYRKVNDSLKEHLIYKRSQVWEMSDISTFLTYFFRMPKKFEDIKKFLPEKNIKELIQLFYILKYQFKLKKCLRIQARRKREETIKDHTKKIIEVLKKKFPGQEFLSQQDLTSLISKKKITSCDVYYEKYGKDTSKIQQVMKDFQDYSRYKETAFGGEKMTDEGPFNADDNSKKGTSQWTYEEKMFFIKLFKQYGRNWNEIATAIVTKSPSQVRNFFQNYKKKLNLDSISEGIDEKTILAAAGITKK